MILNESEGTDECTNRKSSDHYCKIKIILLVGEPVVFLHVFIKHGEIDNEISADN